MSPKKSYSKLFIIIYQGFNHSFQILWKVKIVFLQFFLTLRKKIFNVKPFFEKNILIYTLEKKWKISAVNICRKAVKTRKWHKNVTLKKLSEYIISKMRHRFTNLNGYEKLWTFNGYELLTFFLFFTLYDMCDF